MDLTKYSGSPYGAGGPARNDQQNVLSAVLRGVLGQEETGSVLDPRTAGLKTANDRANLAAILSDVIPGKGAATGGMALAGALRRGGRPDLFLSHGTNVNSLFKGGKLLSEITHPSMAITKDAPKAPWGDLMLIPREGKFDPRTSPAALHDMDAWTPAWNQNTLTSAGNRNAVNSDLEQKLRDAGRSWDEVQLIRDDPELAKAHGFITSDVDARLFDKFGHRWDKGGLNDQGTAAMGVNRFPSFEAFENATRGGAKRLEGGEPVPDQYFDYLNQMVSDPRLPYPDNPAALQGLVKGEVGGKEDQLFGRDIMNALRQSPQEYAELKVFGHVPLTADNFAGVLARQGVHQNVIDALRERGLHVKTYDPYSNNPELVGAMSDDLQNMSRQSMTPVPGSRGPENWNPPIPYDKVVETLRRKALDLAPDGTAKTTWGSYPLDWDKKNAAFKEHWLKFNKIDPSAPTHQEMVDKLMKHGLVGEEWEKFDPETGFGIDAVTPIDTGIPPGGFGVPDVWGAKVDELLTKAPPVTTDTLAAHVKTKTLTDILKKHTDTLGLGAEDMAIGTLGKPWPPVDELTALKAEHAKLPHGPEKLALFNKIHALENPDFGKPVKPSISEEGMTVLDMLNKGMTDEQIGAIPGFEWWIGK